jgi:hypothetical protein
MIATSKGTDKGFYVCQQVLAKTDLAPLKQNDKADLNGSIVKVSLTSTPSLSLISSQSGLAT